MPQRSRRESWLIRRSGTQLSASSKATSQGTPTLLPGHRISRTLDHDMSEQTNAWGELPHVPPRSRCESKSVLHLWLFAVYSPLPRRLSSSLVNDAPRARTTSRRFAWCCTINCASSAGRGEGEAAWSPSRKRATFVPTAELDVCIRTAAASVGFQGG